MGGQQVVRAHVAEHLEPVAADAGEDLALVRDGLREDDVVRADAVGSNEEEAVVPGVVDLADLARADVGPARHLEIL
jgi:hypothetical protein